jgi:hypothetical protein
MKFKYIGNYPLKCLRKQIVSETWAIAFCVPFISLSAFGVWCYGQWALDTSTVINFAGFLFFCAAFMFFSWFWLLKNSRENLICRIVPYFESRVGFGKMHAFSSGIEMAKQCRVLDILASKIGVSPLSAFGFKDDRDGQKLIWHNPADGINTIVRLKEQLQNNPEASLLIQELDLLQNNLELARDKNIKFCLLIRSGLDKFITPMEMDSRKGSFW